MTRLDTLTRAQRARNMRAIKAQATKPEMVVRKLLELERVKFRVNDKRLPGRPDIVVTALKSVILVHGCFWHRHRCRWGQPVPATRRMSWMAKFAANVERDRAVRRELRAGGWRCLVVWECQTRKDRVNRLRGRLRLWLAMNGGKPPTPASRAQAARRAKPEASA